MISAWNEALETTPEAVRMLFTGLFEHPNCLEAHTIKYAESETSDLRLALWHEFQREHTARAMPYCQESRRRLIERCEYKAVEVPLALYELIQAHLPDVEKEWEQR